MTGAHVHAVDLFCGAGGMSEGLGRACERLNRPVYLSAVNHWQRAVESHQANHPWAEHYCARVESLDPRNKTEVVKQIGNAVPCKTAESLCFSALAESAAAAAGEQRVLWEED